MMKLTERQEEVLKTIWKLTKAREFPPTLRELGRTLGIRSTNAVTDHLIALEHKGYIRRIPEISRGIVLTEKCKERFAEKEEAEEVHGAEQKSL